MQFGLRARLAVCAGACDTAQRQSLHMLPDALAHLGIALLAFEFIRACRMPLMYMWCKQRYAYVVRAYAHVHSARTDGICLEIPWRIHGSSIFLDVGLDVLGVFSGWCFGRIFQAPAQKASQEFSKTPQAPVPKSRAGFLKHRPEAQAPKTVWDFERPQRGSGAKKHSGNSPRPL